MFKKYLCLLVVMIAVCCTFETTKLQVYANCDEIFEEFDAVQAWEYPASSAAYIEVCTDSRFVKSGASSAQVKFKSSTSAYEFEFANESFSDGGLLVEKAGKKVTTIGLWVYGCNDDSLSLRFNYVDSKGNALKTKRIFLGFEGWKYVELDMYDAKRIYSILIQSKTATTGNTIYIDAMKLTYIDTPELLPSTPDSPNTIQFNNSNPLNKAKIVDGGDVGSGVTYMNSREVILYDENNQFKMYSPQLAIDGDENTCSSSGLYSSATPSNEWIQVELPEVNNIYKVTITPGKFGSNFPYEFDVDISIDGSIWQTVVQKTNVNASNQTPIDCIFTSAKRAKYVRIISKKLKAQSQNTYYAQFAEIGIYNIEGNNVSLYENGARASASNSLNGDVFDYETFYDDTILTGVSWVNITNEFAYSNYINGRSVVPDATEISNFKKLSDAGIDILYRFTDAPSKEEVTRDRDAAAQRYIAAMEDRVEALKDYVDVWGIFGEINFGGNSYAEDYAYVIKKVADRIKEIDTDAKINIATALIDFEWTERLLRAGVGDVVDIIGVHIYKEQGINYNMPEMSGNFLKNGVDTNADWSPYKDYEEEMTAYKELIESYSPSIDVMVTEVSEPLKNNEKNNIIQAKWLTRQYCIDKSLGVAGTFWFTIDPISAPDIISTLVWTDGQRMPAWYALQNYNSTFAKPAKKSDKTITISGNTSGLKYDIYETDEEYLIPYWYAFPFRSEFNGSFINMDLSRLGAYEVIAVDLLTGMEQEIVLNGCVAENLIARDYVTVLKVKKPSYSDLIWTFSSNTQWWENNSNTIHLGFEGGAWHMQTNKRNNYIEYKYSKDEPPISGEHYPYVAVRVKYDSETTWNGNIETRVYLNSRDADGKAVTTAFNGDTKAVYTSYNDRGKYVTYFMDFSKSSNWNNNYFDSIYLAIGNGPNGGIDVCLESVALLTDKNKIVSFYDSANDVNSVMPENLSVAYGSVVDLKSYVATRPGYKFKGWSKSAQSNDIIDVTDVIKADCKYYAIWEDKAEYKDGKVIMEAMIDKYEKGGEIFIYALYDEDGRLIKMEPEKPIDAGFVIRKEIECDTAPAKVAMFILDSKNIPRPLAKSVKINVE